MIFKEEAARPKDPKYAQGISTFSPRLEALAGQIPPPHPRHHPHKKLPNVAHLPQLLTCW